MILVVIEILLLLFGIISNYDILQSFNALAFIPLICLYLVNKKQSKYYIFILILISLINLQKIGYNNIIEKNYIISENEIITKQNNTETNFFSSLKCREDLQRQYCLLEEKRIKYPSLFSKSHPIINNKIIPYRYINSPYQNIRLFFFFINIIVYLFIIRNVYFLKKE